MAAFSTTILPGSLLYFMLNLPLLGQLLGGVSVPKLVGEKS